MLIQTDRIYQIDAFRGYALFGLFLVHCVELFELHWFDPQTTPIFEQVFFLSAGKAFLMFALSFGGMAYSFYPYVIPEKLTIYDAAAAPESLIIILVGTLFVLPAILAYTALSYFIFRGKARELRYDWTAAFGLETELIRHIWR